MTKTLEQALSAIQAMAAQETQRELALLRRKLAKMERQRDEWKAKSEYYRTKLLERKSTTKAL